MVSLRQVLDRFANQSGTISLTGMARELDTEPAVLQDMINYWVHKGRLREIGNSVCTTCGSAHGCPFVIPLPRSYEYVREDVCENAPPACLHCAHD